MGHASESLTARSGSPSGLSETVSDRRVLLPGTLRLGACTVGSGQAMEDGVERLQGKVGFVTGAGSGIGRAMALRLGSEGAAVMCADLDEAAAQETSSLVAQSGARSAALQLDVVSESSVKGALERTVEELGGLDAVLNNAGIGGAGWGATLDVNLTGVYWGLLHGAELLARHDGGAIVNTASVLGLVGMASSMPRSLDDPVSPGVSAYTASKHGVVGLTRQFALDYAPLGVRVNAISPGFIDTPMISELSEDEGSRRWVESLHPLKRLGKPEEIAAAAAFLVSDDASFITGIALPVDGGYTAR
jgi:NAD(P)-dependent dehydrogenase (short-subunit alcohol dehydrogenase family)